MTKLPPWTKLPSGWIEAKGLKEFRWLRGQGANDLAALMGLTAIANHVDGQTGIARLTYDELCDVTGLSRAKLSAGLGVLTDLKLIERTPDGRGTYRLGGYNPTSGWAQFPAHGLYRNGTIMAFNVFRLRQVAELDALKLYFLFASRRDRRTNLAMISYEKIEEYSGVSRNNIRRALSLLSANSLVYVDYVASLRNEDGVANAYRLVHLNQHLHMGTNGRRMISEGGTDLKQSDFGASNVMDIDLGWNPSDRAE